MRARRSTGASTRRGPANALKRHRPGQALPLRAARTIDASRHGAAKHPRTFSGGALDADRRQAAQTRKRGCEPLDPERAVRHDPMVHAETEAAKFPDRQCDHDVKRQSFTWTRATGALSGTIVRRQPARRGPRARLNKRSGVMPFVGAQYNPSMRRCLTGPAAQRRALACGKIKAFRAPDP